MKINAIKKLSVIGLAGLLVACNGSKDTNKLKFFSPEKNNALLGKNGTEELSSANSQGIADTDPIDSNGLSVESVGLKVDNIGSYIGDKITISSNYYLQIPDSEVNASVNWQIVDAENKEIVTQEGGHQLQWTPEIPGIYTVNHVFLQGDKEVIISKTLYILNETNRETNLTERFWTFADKLMGTWSGSITSPYNGSSTVDIVFHEDGSYTISRLLRNNGYPRPTFGPKPPPPYPTGGPGRFAPSVPAPPPAPAPASPQHATGEPINDNVIIGDDKKEIRPHFSRTQLIYQKEKGSYELLDIWANGEVVGSMQPEYSPPISSENMKGIRFSEDYNNVFFELTRDSYFPDIPETFVLSRVSDSVASPNLDVINEKLVGQWKGSAVAPWAMPFDVTFQFNADGTYQAKSLSDTALYDGEFLGRVGALYFGAVEPPSETNNFVIDKFTDDTASGEISLELKNGDVVSGTISGIEMSINYSVVVFSFKHYGKYGPIQYVLERQ